MSQPNSFGELIRQRREDAGLTQAALGERVGRSASAVRNWERGQSLPGEPEVLGALAEALDLSHGELRDVLEPNRLSFDPSEVIGGTEPETVPESTPGIPGSADERQVLPRVMVEPPRPSQDVVQVVPVPTPPPPAPRLPPDPPIPVEQARREKPAPSGTLAGGERSVVEETTATRRDEVLFEPTMEIPPPTTAVRRAGGRQTRQTSGEPRPQTPRYEQPLSYVEDPEQVAFYRFRAIITATALVVLLLSLFWAVGEFRAALGEVIELF